MNSHALHRTGKIFVLLSLLQFAATSGLQLITIAITAIALPGIFLNKGVTISKNILWGLAVILVIGVAVNLPTQTNQSDFAGIIGPGFYGTGLYLSFLTIIFLYRKNTGGENLFLISLAMILTIIAGGTPRFFPFAAIVALQMIILSLFFRSLFFQSHIAEKKLQIIDMGHITALFFVFLFTGLSALTLNWSETKLSFFLNLIAPPLSGSSAFAPRTTLNSLLNMQPSKRVVLRIKSINPPKYLIGQRYVHYKKNSWEIMSGQETLTPLNIKQSHTIFPKPSGPIFVLNGKPAEISNQKTAYIIDQINLSSTQAGTLFHPSDAAFASLNLPSLNKDRTGVIFYPANIKFSGEYLLARSAPPLFHSKEETGLLNFYLNLPKDFSADIVQLAKKLTLNAGTDIEKAQVILQFFHNNFKYGTSYNFNNINDPLEEFIFKRSAAHCEFFAAGMAVMLRSFGVPARYTTGFLVQEYNGLGGYAIVRERDAHAWVEAYFPEHGWVTYDPTPPGSLNNRSGGSLEWLEKISDFISYKLQQLKALFAGKNPREILLSVLEQINILILWVVKTPWVIGIISLFALTWVISRKKAFPWKSLFSKKTLKEEAFLDPSVIKLKSLMDKLDNHLKTLNLIRPAHLTPLEWSQTITSENSEFLTEESKAAIKEFLGIYSHARYGNKLPPEGEIMQLHKLLDYLQNTTPRVIKTKLK